MAKDQAACANIAWKLSVLRSFKLVLEYNIRTLFQNCNEGFLQHVWVCCTSYYAFGKKGRPVTRFVGIGHKRH
jgi:hypothetical protein